MRHRGVIFEFVASDRVLVDSRAGSAAIEGTLDGNRWVRALRGLVAGLADKLKTRLVDGFGIQDLCVADLELVLGIQLVEPQ